MLRIALIGLIALSVVGLLGLGVAALAPRGAAPVADAVQEAPRVALIVAARPLRAGALLRPEDLSAETVAAADAPPGAVPDGPGARAAQVGAMLRRGLAQGEALRAPDVLPPGERGFLAAVLAPERRAFAIQVDAVTGSANLIWPGDRVDVLLTQQLQEEALPPHRRVLGETALSDLRVIAVDQGLVQGAVAEMPDSGTRPNRVITLEVTAREAERLAVATRLGRLSLLVRSALDAPTAASAPAEGSTWGGDVSPGLRQGRNDAAPPQTMQIFLGTTRREEFRF